MRKLIKLALLILIVVFTSIGIAYHDDLRFSFMDIVVHEIFKTQIFLKFREVLFTVIIIEIVIGIFFVLTKLKKYEILMFIALVLILILFIPLINLHGVDESF